MRRWGYESERLKCINGNARLRHSMLPVMIFASVTGHKPIPPPTSMKDYWGQDVFCWDISLRGSMEATACKLEPFLPAAFPFISSSSCRLLSTLIP
ncbi:hypothetical protein I7I53_09684 [Histoplasma capsulatum var. duboisii H88]|uniref:Uncharacterized protein n=1 Tax=Ajellomyces capsulatus (strain H88) TaxID=544711 RepID=A0A8A1L4N3_AJEC8|nr:hypothetical protein I7I53_09684 [Histoplasma capsulatum var. duboisii H88]